jgi:phosphoribosylanthranilate isomerase
MPIRIKICGITRYEDAKAAASIGVDALGFIFCEKSPRYITPKAAAIIIAQLPPFVSRVGVFVDESPEQVIAVARATGIDTLQLHGIESPSYCAHMPLPVIKAFAIDTATDLSILDHYQTTGFLLDTWSSDRRGGTGKTFDWSIAADACRKSDRIILAGGLNSGNIEEAIETVLPYGVDINSGVEIRPGEKNPHKIRQIVQVIRDWERGGGTSLQRRRD